MDINQKIEKIRKNLGDEDWINPKSKIRESKIGGRGLLAIKPINYGELVIVWGGNYVNNKQAQKAKLKGKLVMQWDEDLFSVENRGEGTGYFVNHSCNPNLWMQGAYSLVAMRNIKIREELTADYAIWEADEKYISKWNCNCGYEKCRGKITGKDWRFSELQKRYFGHFSPLINKKIDQT